MLISPYINQITANGFFKTVKFVKNIEDVDRARGEGLPAVYILPAAKAGAESNSSGNFLSQSIEYKYSFCVVSQRNTDDIEYLDQALTALQDAVFGFIPAADFEPMRYARGSLHDLDSVKSIWLEEYTISKTIKS